MRIRRGLASIAVVSMLVLGCTSTATQSSGGGWITSANGVDQATFGYSFTCGKADNCGSARASGQYDDKGLGVRFRVDSVGTVSETSTCNTADISYSSMNPSRPGKGTATVTVCDGGRSTAAASDSTAVADSFDLVVSGATVRAADSIDVTVHTGPFAGYRNSGPLQGGNLTVR